MTDMSDMTLDELRLALAPAVAEAAAFDGWSELAVHNAAAQRGVDPAVAALAYPGGAMDMIAAWIAHIDAAMAQAFPPERIAAMKIRERITALVRFRLDAMAVDEEALRRALAIMAMPHNAARAVSLGWSTADRMWRIAGDTATDYNHYTKRAMLGGVYATTITVFLDDESAGQADTRAFLARRIDAVMRFESWKHRRAARSIERPSLARFVGRLRYPGR